MDNNTQKALELFQLPKVGQYCSRLFSEPGPTLFQNLGMGIFTLSGLILGFLWGWANHSGFLPVLFFTILGSCIGGGVLFGLSYVSRNAISKVLVRWKIGLPSLLAAILLYYINPDFGSFAIILAIFIWGWPLWPLLVIFLALFVAVAPALSKMGGSSMGGRR